MFWGERQIEPTLPSWRASQFVSAAVLAQKAKAVDDGIFARIELLADVGAGRLGAKRDLLARSPANWLRTNALAVMLSSRGSARVACAVSMSRSMECARAASMRRCASSLTMRNGPGRSGSVRGVPRSRRSSGRTEGAEFAQSLVMVEAYVDAPMNRDEFRAHCDRYKTQREIIAHLG